MRPSPIQTERGIALLAAVFLIVVISFLGVIIVSLVSTQSFTGLNELSSTNSFYAAEGGIEEAMYQFKTGTACNALANTSALGIGSFTTTGTFYNPAPATLSASILSTHTVVPVNTIAGYAPHGNLSIESEQMRYSGLSTTNCAPFSAPCFTGVQRGVSGTAAAGHALGQSVIQSQCLIGSTGAVGGPLAGGQRVVRMGMPAEPPGGSSGASTAFLDGGSVGISDTIETTLGSLATNLPAGTNVIIVVASFYVTSNARRDILAGNLRLRKGAAVLASNESVVRAKGGAPNNDNFPQATHFLLYQDTGSAANPTYSVTALASGNNMSGEVKMIVMSGVPNASFLDGGNVNIGTTETTILNRATTLPAGDNIVLAAVQLDNASGNGAGSVGAGNVRLKRGAATLASNQFAITLTRPNRGNRETAVLLMYRDVGVAADPTYTVTALASDNDIDGEAKILVLSGLQSAFLDTGQVAIGTAETAIGTLNTSFPAGESVVIAATQFNNTNNNQRNILVGNERIVADGATQSSNEYDRRLCGTGTATECREFTSGLLWRRASGSSSPAFSVRALASAAGINGEAKIMAIRMNNNVIDRQEIFN